MNALVMDTAYNINIWFVRLGNNIACTFAKVGYARAASELARLGYYQEAKRCIEEIRKLD